MMKCGVWMCAGHPPGESKAGDEWTCPECGSIWTARMLWICEPLPKGDVNVQKTQSQRFADKAG